MTLELPSPRMGKSITFADLGTGGRRVYATRSNWYRQFGDDPIPEGHLAVDKLHECRIPLRQPYIDNTFSPFELRSVEEAVSGALGISRMGYTDGVYICATGGATLVHDLEGLLQQMIVKESQGLKFGNAVVEVLGGEEEARYCARAGGYFLEDKFPGIDLRSSKVFFAALGGGRTNFGWIRDRNIEDLGAIDRGVLALSGELNLLESHGDIVDRIYSGIDEGMGIQHPDIMIISGGIMRELDRFNQSLYEVDLFRHPHIPRPFLLSHHEVDELCSVLQDKSSDELIERYSVRPDRACRLVVAAEMLNNIMKGRDVEQVLIPDCGFREGIIIELTGMLPVWGRDLT